MTLFLLRVHDRDHGAPVLVASANLVAIVDVPRRDRAGNATGATDGADVMLSTGAVLEVRESVEEILDLLDAVPNREVRHD